MRRDLDRGIHRHKRVATALAALAAIVAACGGNGTTDPTGEELPVSWAAVVSPPGSFEGYSCGLTEHGAAYCWGTIPGIGRSRRPIAVAGGYTFSSIGAGTFRACGLTVQGRAVCWAQYTVNNPPPLPPTLVDTLEFSTLAVGSPYACGLVEQRLYCHDHLSTSFWPHADSVRFQAVASGAGAMCALSLDGVAWCWNAIGSDVRPDNEQVVRGPTPFRALSVGRYQRCAIAVDDSTYCWAPPEDADAAAGGRVSVPLAGGHRFRTISVGTDYACGVSADAAAWCWGSNHYGQFGSGEVRPTATGIPVAVSGGLRFSSISAGWSTTCGVTIEHLAYCWGNAKSGQVGDATPQQPPSVLDRRLVPTRVANPLR